MAIFKKLKSIFKKKKVKKPIPRERVKIVEEVKKPPVKRPPVKKKVFREAYKVLKEPHVSEKATILAGENKYIFKVYPTANRIEVKKAIESIYGARVKDINMINVPRKRKEFKGIEGFKTGYKKAIVTLEEGEKIEVIPR